MQKWAEQFYKSRRWRDTRDAYAQSAGHLCERCREAGLYEPGEIVHHKTHLTQQNIDDPNVSLSWDNLMLLCRKCHEDEHKADAGMRYAFTGDGELIPPIENAYLRLCDRSVNLQKTGKGRA